MVEDSRMEMPSVSRLRYRAPFPRSRERMT